MPSDSLVWAVTKQSQQSTAGVIPSATAILSTWRDAANLHRASISRPNAPALGVQWIGPAPRITRTTGVMGPQTTVTWLFQIPTGIAAATREFYARTFANGNRGDTVSGGRAVSLDSVVEQELPATAWDRVVALATGNAAREVGSSWQPAELVPFSPAIHGDIAWWQSGRASQTLSREEPRVGQVDQNPYGPDTADTTPQNPLDQLKTGLDQFKTLGYLAVAGLAIYAVIRIVPLVASAAPAAKAPRANPRRRRRR